MGYELTLNGHDGKFKVLLENSNVVSLSSTTNRLSSNVPEALRVRRVRKCPIVFKETMDVKMFAETFRAILVSKK